MGENCHSYYHELISLTYKELLEIYKKMTNHLVEKNGSRISTEKEISLYIYIYEKLLNLTMQEMQNKYTQTLIRLAKSKKVTQVCILSTRQLKLIEPE